MCGRPTPEQMAMATAIKGCENEIRQDMVKFFKNMKVEMSDAFKKMDMDGDGFLTKDEIKEVMKKNSKTWGHVDDGAFDQVDINDDGKISIDGNFSFSKILQFCFFISSFDFRIFEVEFGWISQIKWPIWPAKRNNSQEYWSDFFSKFF